MAGKLKIYNDSTSTWDYVGQGLTLDAIYPVGSIYISVNSTNPATLFGIGTWEAFAAGKTLVGIDSTDTDFDTSEETRGAKTHSLVNANLPLYNSYVSFHGAGSATAVSGITPGSGGIVAGTSRSSYHTNATTAGATSYDGFSLNIGQATPTPISNIQPSIVVYMWKRTA